MLSIPQLAKRLNISRTTAYYFVKCGKIKSLELTPTLIRIEESAVEEYLESLRNKPTIKQFASNHKRKSA